MILLSVIKYVLNLVRLVNDVADSASSHVTFPNPMHFMQPHNGRKGGRGGGGGRRGGRGAMGRWRENKAETETERGRERDGGREGGRESQRRFSYLSFPFCLLEIIDFVMGLLPLFLLFIFHSLRATLST